MSARSTGRAAVTVTVPVARSTTTDSTPSTAAISSVTARRQWTQVMPVTVKVVEPMKVWGVADSTGTPRRAVGVRSGTSVGPGAGASHRGNRRDPHRDRRPWSPASAFLDRPVPVGTVGLVLAGRDAERAAIAALLDAARTGSGGALVVRGVAGSGKSTLLTDALGAASGM